MGRLFLPFDIAGGSVLANRREPDTKPRSSRPPQTIPLTPNHVWLTEPA